RAGSVRVRWFREGIGSGLALGLACRLLLAEPGPTAQLAGLLVVLVGAEVFLDPAAFDQLLEAAQGRPDGFAVVNPHTQRHWSSFRTGRPRSREHRGVYPRLPAVAPRPRTYVARLVAHSI